MISFYEDNSLEIAALQQAITLIDMGIKLEEVPTALDLEQGLDKLQQELEVMDMAMVPLRLLVLLFSQELINWLWRFLTKLLN